MPPGPAVVPGLTCGFSGRSRIRTWEDCRRRFTSLKKRAGVKGLVCPFLWRFRAGFGHAGRGAGVKVETSSVNPLARRPGIIVWLRRSGRYRAEGPVAVGDVDGLVVGHVVGEAVPEDFEPAVAEGAQGRVVVLAAGALGVVELPGPGGAAQAGERPF